MMMVWEKRICSPFEHGLVDAVDAERVGVGDPAHLVVLAVDVVHPGNLGKGAILNADESDSPTNI